MYAGATVLGDVRLGPGASVSSGAVLQGPLTGGRDVRVEARALVGGPAQHRAGTEGSLVLGDRVRVGECATIHRGSPAGDGVTRLGDDVFVMAYAHVGHDAVLEDGVTVANGAQLGGHVRVGALANIGARAALHQFTHVGRGAMVAAGAIVTADVPPWTLVAGDRAGLVGPNSVALRARFGAESVDAVKRALARLWPRGHDRGGALPDLEPVRDLLAFASAPRKRAVCRRRRP